MAISRQPLGRSAALTVSRRGVPLRSTLGVLHSHLLVTVAADG